MDPVAFSMMPRLDRLNSARITPGETLRESRRRFPSRRQSLPSSARDACFGIMTGSHLFWKAFKLASTHAVSPSAQSLAR